MEELVVKIILGLVMLVGAVGSFLPILPGKPIAFGALLFAKIFDYSELNWWVIAIFGLLTIVGIILDYAIPIVATRKLGGSKYGVAGLIVGLIVGIFFSPFGFWSLLIAPFLGALIGEMLNDRKNPNKAVKAASGSLLGYILTGGFGLLICLSMFAAFFVRDILFM